jgi:PAS domain S-box-containing protein
MASHYRDTFRLAGAGLARVAVSGQFLDVNEHFCAMIGYPAEALLAMRFHDITHPDDLQTNVDILGKAKRRELDAYRLQKRYIRGNGEILWADLNASVLRDDAGEVTGMIAIVTDIGAFKRAEERMDFLMGERAHRSKNLFTVVLNLIGQTRADTVDEFRRIIESRIIGLAASQDLMRGERGDVASFRALVDQQLGAFVAPADPRVVREGPDIELGANATRIIGMVLHELATNSCKYGALSVPGGSLTLSIVAAPETPETVEFRWRERGGPPVTPPTSSGFGRRVVERMVSRSLDAEVRLDFDPLGLSWTCRVRRANLRA